MSVESEEIELLRARVVEMEARLDFLYKRLGVIYTPGAAVMGAQEEQILEMVRKNKLIEAIKLHRQFYNSSLVEAKEAVEALAKANR